AVTLPMPSIDVKEITARLSRGISITAIRAIGYMHLLSLSLFLFMFRVFTNNHYFPASFNDFTFLTNRLYRCSYFHCFYLLYSELIFIYNGTYFVLSLNYMVKVLL